MDSISVVLCTFNGARFLDAQLCSLLAQDHVTEIVAVDDGSSDQTVPLLEAYAARDARLRVHCNAVRLGVNRNFERAIQLAAGEWIALSDQDDIWLPRKLALLQARWDRRAVLLHHATHKFIGGRPGRLPSPAGQPRKFAGTDLRRLLYRNSVVGHTVLVRAEIARRLLPFPADVPHDWWLGAAAAAYGPVQYVDEYLVHYRIHDANAYHRAGTRLLRMRTEHRLRLNLLRRLESWTPLPPATRAFVREYRALLRAAEARLLPWRLFGFYFRHATLFFGGRASSLSWFTRLRKSLAATCGVVAQRRSAASRARGWPWAVGADAGAPQG